MVVWTMTPNLDIRFSQQPLNPVLDQLKQKVFIARDTIKN